MQNWCLSFLTNLLSNKPLYNILLSILTLFPNAKHMWRITGLFFAWNCVSSTPGRVEQLLRIQVPRFPTGAVIWLAATGCFALQTSRQPSNWILSEFTDTLYLLWYIFHIHIDRSKNTTLIFNTIHIFKTYCQAAPL